MENYPGTSTDTACNIHFHHSYFEPAVYEAKRLH
jgi:hypothetical protein